VTDDDAWEATIEFRRDSEAGAERLARALAPESTREVPRARATVGRPGPLLVRLTISARDTGAARAALNTYLGWIQLAISTEQRVASR
jgi:tRNA threonylcarbamoyladenosine modification (KEOPS) complex  Pcc1 subunit